MTPAIISSLGFMIGDNQISIDVPGVTTFEGNTLIIIGFPLSGY
jgi:hypothetical protein